MFSGFSNAITDFKWQDLAGPAFFIQPISDKLEEQSLGIEDHRIRESSGLWANQYGFLVGEGAVMLRDRFGMEPLSPEEKELSYA